MDLGSPRYRARRRASARSPARRRSVGEHVLVSAHSNVAVDTAMLATRGSNLKFAVTRGLLVDGTVVRAGPAIVPEAIERALSARELVLKKIPNLAADLARLNRRLRQPGLRKDDVTPLRSELAEVRKEIRRLERALVGAARVVFCTLPKATIDDSIRGRQFTCVAVDEASMALPAQVRLRRLAGFEPPHRSR